MIPNTDSSETQNTLILIYFYKHSAHYINMRSGTDVEKVRRSGVQSGFQFSWVEVRALRRRLKILHSNLHTPCLHETHFVHKGIVMLEHDLALSVARKGKL